MRKKMLHESTDKQAYVKHLQELKKPFYYDEYNTDQKHQNGYLVDSMHHTQIKVRFAVRVRITEKIPKHRPKVEILSQTTHDR
jgi:hypothetical protein